MKLQAKILSAVVIIISVITATSAYIEVRRQISENVRLEDEFQSIQAANAVSIFENAIWQLDNGATNAALRGLFQSTALRRAQVILPQGKVFEGMHFEEKAAHLAVYGDGSHESSDKLVSDEELTIPVEKLMTPTKPFSIKPTDKLTMEQLGGYMRRIVATLWYQSDQRTEPRFVGHLVVEYSIEKAYERAAAAMWRLIAANIFTGILMVLLLFLAIRSSVVWPINQLSTASRRIADGDFHTAVTVHSQDEIGELASSFDEMRRKVKDFTENLQQMVDIRTAEVLEGKRKIQQIMMHIEQGILTFGKDQKIDSEFSDFLMRFLDATREKIAGSHVNDLIFEKIKISPNDRDQMTAALQAIVGEEVFAFDLNNSLLIREAEFEVSGNNYIASFEWTPIIDDTTGLIVKMMLSIKDLTQQRELERRIAEEHDVSVRTMRHISEIIKVGRQKVESALDDAKIRLARVEESLASRDGGDPAGIFVDLHTVKGNARTLGLKELIESTHYSEGFVAKWRGNLPYNRAEFISSLGVIIQGITAYENTLNEVIGSGSGSGSGNGNESNFNGFTSFGLFAPFSSIMQQIKRNAEENNIAIKSMIVKDMVCDWDESNTQPLCDMLLHGMTNACDHGYILPKKSGENVGAIEIEITARCYGQNVILEVRDHGFGVSLEKLRTLAKKLHLPLDEANPFDILFMSGVSTADNLTQSSGRGIGLTAIRQIARELGGDATMSAHFMAGTCLTVSIPAARVMKKGSLPSHATADTKKKIAA